MRDNPCFLVERLPIIPEICGEPLKRKLYVLRGDVERLGATDGCVACINLTLGNRPSVTHRATCTRRWQELLEKGEMGRVRLGLRWLRQPVEAVAGQPPGMRPSDESEERAQQRLQSISAGKAAVPSTEVLNESIHAGSRTSSRHSHRRPCSAKGRT